jgi:hypothetical protein
MRFCAHCGARLGLLRHSDGGKEFCAKECLTDYQDSLERVCDVHMRQWRDYLYGQRP